MKYQEEYKKLLEAQKNQTPIPRTLTIRQMGEALGIGSTSYVRYIVKSLIKQGKVEAFIQGTEKHVYYIKDEA